MDPSTLTDVSTRDLLILIEITAQAGQRAVAQPDGKEWLAMCISEIRRHADALTNCPDCPKL